MNLQTINKHKVLKAVRNNGVWKGFISPNFVSESHVNGGWHIGMEIEIRKDNLQYFVWNNETNESTELETFLNSYKYYNCNNSLGYRVRFWEKLKQQTELEFAISKGFKIETKILVDGSVSASWVNGKCIEVISMDEAKALGILKEEIAI